MMLRCPVCHVKSSLEAFAQDEASSEMLNLAGELPPSLWRALRGYLGLFRPATRDLAMDRALKLAKEVLAFGADPRQLEPALVETVESIRVKREQGQNAKPLSGHNYLKRVLESQGPISIAVETTAGQEPLGPILPMASPRSKRAQGITALEAWSHE